MPSAAGSRPPLLLAEKPIPESSTAVAVTRHLRLGFRSEKPNRLDPHFLVFGVGTRGVDWYGGSLVVRDHELVRE